MKRIEDVTLLYEISKALNEHLDLKKSLYKVLDILSSSMNMPRGTLTLLNPLKELPAGSSRPVKRSPFQKLVKSRCFLTVQLPERPNRIRNCPLFVCL